MSPGQVIFGCRVSKKGWRGPKLFAVSGVNRARISRYESGQSGPAARTPARLSHAFRVNAYES